MKFLEKDTHATPATTEMFSEDPSEKLSEEKREICHRTTAKGLFSCKRARPDAQPVVAVLSTRV